MATLSQKVKSREAQIKAIKELKEKRNSSTSELLDKVRSSPNPSDYIIEQDNGSTRRLRENYERNRIEEPLPREEPAREPDPSRVSDARAAILEDQERIRLNKGDTPDPHQGSRDAINFDDNTRENLNPVEHSQGTKDFRYKVNFSDALRKSLNRFKSESTVIVPVIDPDGPEIEEVESYRRLLKPISKNSDLGDGNALADNTPGLDKGFRDEIGHIDSYDTTSDSTTKLREKVIHEDKEFYIDTLYPEMDKRGDERKAALESDISRRVHVSDDDKERRNKIKQPPTGLGPYLGYALGVTNDFFQGFLGPRRDNFFNGAFEQAPQIIKDSVEWIDRGMNKLQVSPLNKFWRVQILKNRAIHGGTKRLMDIQGGKIRSAIYKKNTHLAKDGRSGVLGGPADAKIYGSVARNIEYTYISEGVPKNWFEYRVNNNSDLAQDIILDPKKSDERHSEREMRDRNRYNYFSAVTHIPVSELKSNQRGMKAPEPLKSPINNVVSIMNLSTPDLKTITLQHRPTEIEVNPESNWVSVNSMGRNNPFVMYTGGDHKISINIAWFSKEDPASVINSCRLLESWSKADGYYKAPPLLKLIWGTSGMFDNQTWILESAPYKLTGFRNGHRKPYPNTPVREVGDNLQYLKDPSNFVDTKLYPGYATQTLTFKLVTKYNLRHIDMIPDEEVDKLCTPSEGPMAGQSKTLQPN